jgi:hypothetical protein
MDSKKVKFVRVCMKSKVCSFPGIKKNTLRLLEIYLHLSGISETIQKPLPETEAVKL